MTSYKKYDEIRKGDIFIVALPKDNGHVQGGIRPCMVVSNNMGNTFSPNVTVVPLTSQQKKFLPTHVLLNAGCGGLEKNSTVTAEQLMTIPKNNLGNYIGRLSDVEIASVDAALMISLGISMRTDYISSLSGITSVNKKNLAQAV